MMRWIKRVWRGCLSKGSKNVAGKAAEKTLEEMIGQLIQDEDWIDVVASMLDEAKHGNVSAAKWLTDRFWPKAKRFGHEEPAPIESRRERLLRLAEFTRGSDRAAEAG